MYKEIVVKIMIPKYMILNVNLILKWDNRINTWMNKDWLVYVNKKFCTKKKTGMLCKNFANDQDFTNKSDGYGFCIPSYNSIFYKEIVDKCRYSYKIIKQLLSTLYNKYSNSVVCITESLHHNDDNIILYSKKERRK